MEHLIEYIVLTFSDGTARVMSFLQVGRGHILPSGAFWTDTQQRTWYRPATTANVNAEIETTAFYSETETVLETDGVPVPIKVVSWRIGSLADKNHPVEFNGCRIDTPSGLTHDMAKAREVCRNIIRRARAGQFVELDGQWMRAIGQGDTLMASVVEAERQKLRDAPADPRIDAAQSVKELKALL